MKPPSIVAKAAEGQERDLNAIRVTWWCRPERCGLTTIETAFFLHTTCQSIVAMVGWLTSLRISKGTFATVWYARKLTHESNPAGDGCALLSKWMLGTFISTVTFVDVELLGGAFAEGSRCQKSLDLAPTSGFHTSCQTPVSDKWLQGGCRPGSDTCYTCLLLYGVDRAPT